MVGHSAHVQDICIDAELQRYGFIAESLTIRLQIPSRKKMPSTVQIFGALWGYISPLRSFV
jgi:hypothetical protein